MLSPDTTIVEMIFPEQTNHYGTLFGGNGLALLAKAGFVAASRRTRSNVVMAACRNAVFKSPVRLGEVLELNGSVIRIGRTSLTVRVEGVAEILLDGQRRPVMSAEFDMVAVDQDGRPTPIKPAQMKEEHIAAS